MRGPFIERVLRRFAYVRELEKGIDDLLAEAGERSKRLVELTEENEKLKAVRASRQKPSPEKPVETTARPIVKKFLGRDGAYHPAPVDIDLYVKERLAEAVQKTPVDLLGPFNFNLNPFGGMWQGLPGEQLLFSPVIFHPSFLKTCVAAAQSIGIGAVTAPEGCIALNRHDWDAYAERYMAEIVEWAKTDGYIMRIDARRKAREAARAVEGVAS